MIERALLLVAACLCGPAVAQQTGWDVFMARCLGPMSEVHPPIVDGLTEGGSETVTRIMGGRSETQIDHLVRDDVSLTLIPEGDSAFLGCVVIDESATAERASDQFETWLADGIAAQAWEERRGASLLGASYYSTTWREPKLRLDRLAAPDGNRAIIVLSVSATDLES